MLEKDIENKSRLHAKSKGWLPYKFTSPSRRSVPDRIFITPKGFTVFVEFKRSGKKATESQQREIERLRGNGAFVIVIDSVAKFKSLVELLEWCDVT